MCSDDDSILALAEKTLDEGLMKSLRNLYGPGASPEVLAEAYKKHSKTTAIHLTDEQRHRIIGLVKSEQGKWEKGASHNGIPSELGLYQIRMLNKILLALNADP